MIATGMYDEYATRYQPLITLAEAAEIARCPLGTIYDWSSRGLFSAFKTKRGRRVLLDRNKFLRFLLDDDRAD